MHCSVDDRALVPLLLLVAQELGCGECQEIIE